MKNSYLILALLISTMSYAQTTLTKTAAVVNTTNNGIEWWDLQNGSEIDGAYVFTEICSNSPSSVLTFSDFQFNLPTDVEILGVELRMFKFASDENEVTDADVSLVLSDNTIGDNNASVDLWLSELEEVTYGGESSLWGTDLSEEIINDSSFGFQIITNPAAVFCQNAFIDYAEMSITYNTVLATNDQTLINLVDVAPNPTSNYITISNKGYGVLDQVEVLSLTGKTLLTHSGDALEKPLLVAHLASGVYFLKISSEGETAVVRFIKN